MLQFILYAALSFAVDFGPPSSADVKEPFRWTKVAENGTGCFAPKCRDGQFAMAVKPVVGFGGKLYLVGDRTIWFSDDGVKWESRAKTNWDERYGMQFAYFRGQLWMLGGMRSWDDFRNDVWSSSNGVDWKQVSANAPWSKRRWHSVFVHRERLWLVGGALSSGRQDKTPTEFVNDVWSSADGIDWRLESESTPLAVENGLTAFSFGRKIYVVSGNGKIWSSENGKEWQLVAQDLPWGGNGGGVLVYDDRIWVLGGSNRNDVWSSDDGKKWKREFSVVPFSKRNTEYSVVFKDKIWLFSGKTGREDSWDGAIWSMSKTEGAN